MHCCRAPSGCSATCGHALEGMKELVAREKGQVVLAAPLLLSSAFLPRRWPRSRSSSVDHRAARRLAAAAGATERTRSLGRPRSRHPCRGRARPDRVVLFRDLSSPWCRTTSPSRASGASWADLRDPARFSPATASSVAHRAGFQAAGVHVGPRSRSATSVLTARRPRPGETRHRHRAGVRTRAGESGEGDVEAAYTAAGRSRCFDRPLGPTAADTGRGGANGFSGGVRATATNNDRRCHSRPTGEASHRTRRSRGASEQGEFSLNSRSNRSVHSMNYESGILDSSGAILDSRNCNPGRSRQLSALNLRGWCPTRNPHPV